MVTLGISTWSIHRFLAADPRRLLDVPAMLRAHGLTDLQVCEFQLPSRDDGFLRDLRRAIEANGVTLDALLIDHGDVAHPERHEAEAGVIAGWLDVAAALGARHARVAAGDQPPTDAALERSAAHLCRLRDLGRDRGVRVVTENWKRLLPSPREVLRLIELTDATVPLCLDFGNWRGPSKYDELATIAPHAVTVHAKCGFAADAAPDAVDFARCCGVLESAGYAGTLALIYDGPPDDEWAMLDVERDLARQAFGP